MKYFLSIFSVFFLFSCSYDTLEIDPDAGLISGRIDAVSGPTGMSALEGARISTEPSSSEAITDHNGRFLLREVAAGRYIVRGKREQYYVAHEPVEVESRKASSFSMIMYIIQEGNLAPTAPVKPFPPDSQLLWQNSFLMAWNSTDPEEEQIFYDVYLDNTYPPNKRIAHDIPDNTFAVDSLEAGTYYWRVDARDWWGASNFSPIWMFKVK